MQDKREEKGLPRSVEFLIALGGLVCLFPLLLLCAILVRLSSSGNVLFSQKRVGRGGKLFTLYKFRTMVASSDGLPVTAATDQRITFFGKFLRKSKLDELPELYNILRGEMSFVGPRPEVPELVDLQNPAWQKILSVRPGLTDPVTIRLRNEENLLAEVEDKKHFYRKFVQPYKLAGYLKYVESKSWKNDLILIVQTLKVVILPHKIPSPTIEEIKNFS